MSIFSEAKRATGGFPWRRDRSSSAPEPAPAPTPERSEALITEWQQLGKPVVHERFVSKSGSAVTQEAYLLENELQQILMAKAKTLGYKLTSQEAALAHSYTSSMSLMHGFSRAVGRVSAHLSEEQGARAKEALELGPEEALSLLRSLVVRDHPRYAELQNELDLTEKMLHYSYQFAGHEMAVAELLVRPVSDKFPSPLRAMRRSRVTARAAFVRQLVESMFSDQEFRQKVGALVIEARLNLKSRPKEADPATAQ